MSEAVGTLSIGETGEEVFIGREWVQNKNFSEDTARLVDAEVKRIVEEAHSRCRKLLQDNEEILHRIARALLDRETITGDELDLLMDSVPTASLMPHSQTILRARRVTRSMSLDAPVVMSSKISSSATRPPNRTTRLFFR